MSKNNLYYADALKKARKDDGDADVRAAHVQAVVDYLLEVGIDGRTVEACEGDSEFRLLVHRGTGRGMPAKEWLEAQGVVL